MGVNRHYLWLLLVFALVLGTRVFFAFQSPYSSYEGYFNLRQIDAIRNTGKPLFYDPLSFSGRNIVFMPVFHYTLAITSLFLPLGFVAKFFPALFASSLVFIIYLISEKLTKNRRAALFAALFAGFIPVFIDTTLFSISPLTLAIPLIFYAVFCFMNITRKIFLYQLIALMFILPLISPITLIFVASLLLYLLLVKLEKIKEERAEIELVFFFAFLITWLYFLLYKKAFLFHDISIIWQNIPKQMLARFFYETHILEAIYQIGIIPFICGIYIVYRYIFREKKKFIYLLVSFVFVTSILLWLKLVQPKIALTILGIVFVLLFSQFYTELLAYVRKTHFAKQIKYVHVIFLVLFFITSVTPTLTYSYFSLRKVPTKEEFAAFKWINDSTPKEAVVLATPTEGHIIAAVSQRKNVIDNNYLFIKDSEKIYDDVKTIYTSKSDITTIDILNKYNISYIIFSERAKVTYNIDKVNFASNKKCFELMHNNSVKIYYSRCKLW